MDYELLDLYDENRNLTGEVVKRFKNVKPEVPDGRFINIVIIFMENSRGEFLIQHTSVEKGGVYATTGGHVKSGSTSRDTVIIEVSEELGIDISNLDFKLFETVKFNKCFFDVYYLKHDFNIEDLVYQEDEVESCSWMSINDILDLMHEDKLRKSNIKPLFSIIKDHISSDLDFIVSNRDRSNIKVTDEDINKVKSVLDTDDYDSIVACKNEMDDIINGIVISIDNELKDLLNKSNTDDINIRMDILSRIISISEKISGDNKAYFMGIIKQIYNNIDGDKLC